MLDLTREERKVILFLAAVALLGAGANFAAKQFSPGKSIASFSRDLGRVDLNAADKKMLMGISGIGEKLAQRILDYRQEHSGISSVDELKDIKGMSASRFAGIREYLSAE